jgi:hypothetical protein
MDMDNAETQIEELQQQIDFLRHQLACSNAKILQYERDFRAFEASSKNEMANMWKQAKNIADIQNDTCRKILARLRETDLFLWPVINKAFPDFDRDMRRIIDLIGEPTDQPGEIQPRLDL